MFQQNIFVHHIRTQSWRWLSLLAVLLLLLLAQSAQAAQFGVQLIFVHVPPQQVDTDGDGDLDPFSADFAVNSDGTASGTIHFNPHNKVTLKRGIMQWTGDDELAILEGDRYRLINGKWRLIGSTQARICYPCGQDVIVFDIIDSFQPASFAANGEWQRNYTAGVIASITQVDTDGDNVLDSFSAYSFAFSGGVSVGAIQLDTDSRIVVSSGAAVCQAGEAVLVFSGTHQRFIGGTWVAAGDVDAQARPAGGGGGGDIVVFDIIDSVTNQSVSFEAPAELGIIADPCIN